ncbi:MAG: hypothetical protein ABFS34_12175 [Gemmatimonadota bacterium]
MLKFNRVAALALAAFATMACDDTTGPTADGTAVAIRFQTAFAPSASVSLAGGGAGLTIVGTNGVVTIDGLYMVVAEFEMKRNSSDVCTDIVGMDDDNCEEWEAGPFFVDVPLDGGSTIVVSQVVPADTYREIDFEVEDLDETEEDPADAPAVEALLADIQAAFPDWPKDASIRIEGNFQPTGGDPQPFAVFFEAEIEIERTLEPPLVVSGDEAQRTISIELDPSLWFTQGDGTVQDLSVLDGTLVEFQVDVENGITQVEFD